MLFQCSSERGEALIENLATAQNALQSTYGHNGQELIAKAILHSRVTRGLT